MRKFLTIAWIFIAVQSATAGVTIGTPSQVTPKFTTDAKVLAEMRKLLPFVTEATRQPVVDHMPRVVWRTQAEMNAMAQNKGPGDTLGAQFGNVIFLLDTLKLPRDDFVLVHELAHWLQFENQTFHDSLGRPHDLGSQTCEGKLEPEAYRAQDLWVKATGRGLPANGLLVLIMESCDEDE